MTRAASGDARNRILGILAFAILSVSIASAAPPAHNVVIVSLDGLRPDTIEPSRTPVLCGLLARGAGTLAARTVMPSVTLVAHASMVTGVEPSRHGITWNTEHQQGPLKARTIFQIATRQGLSTAIIASKKRLLQLVPPGDPTEVELPGYTADKVARAAVAYLRRMKPRLCLVHLTDADSAGHDSGWMSPAYLKAVARTDRALGQFLDGLRGSGLDAGTLVIVTADHGGRGKRHGSRAAEDMTIPWIAVGPGVRAGHQISGRVSICDTAATALWALELPEPAELSGRAVLEAFEPAIRARPGAMAGED